MLAIAQDSLDRLQELAVADIMSRDVAVIPCSAGMDEAAGILAAAAASGAPVVDNMGRCIGVLSTTDFVRYHASRGCAISPEWGMEPSRRHLPCDAAQRFMSTAVQSVAPDAPLLLAGQIMCAEHIHRLIVLDERSAPAGVVSTLDIVSAMISAIEENRSQRHI